MWKAAAVGASMLLVAALCSAQDTATLPTTRAAPSNQERLSDLVALIEGQSSPEARRTIARELLLHRWPETPPRVIAILNGPNSATKIALAAALMEVPEVLGPAYVEPLMGMLVDADAGVREAAASALAAYPNNGVTARLRQLALDRERPRPARLAAIAALGLMTERAAVEGLVRALSDPDPGLAQAALAALGRATAMDFNDDIPAARRWWEESTALSLEAWQQQQIERLVRKDRENRRRLEAVEARLAKVLEASFLRAPDAERVALLTGYLTDSSTTIRQLGLKLTQLHLAEGKSLPLELQDRIRELLSSAEAFEQAAAVRTVASFREPRDAERFLEMLFAAHKREVRLAVLNGLGHVGTGAAAEALLKVLEDADEQCVTEAVAALGRLAERGVLESGAREAVAAALLSVFERTKPAQAALRERVLWAMGNVADPHFGPAFVTALERQEAVPVRQAAVRGIAALKDAQLADALAAAAGDPDAGVRKTAVEALATLGSGESEKHVQALWERVVSPQEADETIRQAAWRGLLDLLSKGPVESVERWVARLPAAGAQDGQRTMELLERLVKSAQESEPVDRERLGRLRALFAAQYARLEQPSEAVAAYVEALSDLHAAESEAAGRVAPELLRYALTKGRYDEAVAAAVASADPRPDHAALLWQTVKAAVEPRLTPDGAEQALAMLTAIERYPPATWSAVTLEEAEQMRARALQLRQSSVQSAPATQPGTGPSSRPSR